MSTQAASGANAARAGAAQAAAPVIELASLDSPVGATVNAMGMLHDAVKLYAGTADAVLDGQALSEKSLLLLFCEGLRSGAVQLYLLLVAGDVAGLALVGEMGDWLQGHLLYLLPGFRGQRLAERHLPAMADLARSRGLAGFRIFSSSRRWPGMQTLDEPRFVSAGGVPIYEHRRAAASVTAAVREGAQ